MSYCSRSCRRRFTELNFKSAFSRFCGHCQQHFSAHAQKTAIWQLPVKVSAMWGRFPLIFCTYTQNVIRFSDSGFLTKCEISAISFLHFISWKFAVFLLLFHFTYCASFEVAELLLMIRCVTLWLWLLTLWSWLAPVHGGSRGQHCEKVRRSYAYPFLSYELPVQRIPMVTIENAF